MIVISVAFEAKPEKVAEFKALITEHARRSLTEEPGCRQFDVAQDPKDATKFALWEVYDDEKAFEFHRGTPRMAENGKKIAELITSRELRVLNMLPGDKPQR
jgi:autoinducer 2-degrading protein